jgi:hypothetical protein
MSVFYPGPSIPGIRSDQPVDFRRVYFGQARADDFLPAGLVIDSTKSRDPLNSTRAHELRAGLLLGQVSSTKKLASAIIGLSSAALASGGTTLSSSAATATEIVRRIGTSGTLTLTGPSTAGGTVRSKTVTFSNVNTSTGDITITSPSSAVTPAVNEVKAMPVVDSSGSGNFTLTIEGITTGAIAYSATIATLISNINTALNTTFGTSAIVASGASLAALIFTFSGSGYSGRDISGQITATYTTLTGATIGGSNRTSTTTTEGSSLVPADNGAFVSGSIIGDTDGSQVPLTFISDSDPIRVTDINGVNIDAQLGYVPVGGFIDPRQFINWPSDTALQAWIIASLNTNSRNFTYVNQWGL